MRNYGQIEPALKLFEDGQISGSKLREVLCAWADGKPFKLPEADSELANYRMLFSDAMKRSSQLEEGLRRALKIIDGPYRDKAGLPPSTHPAVDDLRALIE